MKSSLAHELAMDALLMAIWRWRPESEMVIPSNQGVQGGSDDGVTAFLQPSRTTDGGLEIHSFVLRISRAGRFGPSAHPSDGGSVRLHIAHRGYDHAHCA